ncbi:cadherin-4-like [Physella acuta]|uniref:cadherin-4-like n=1 Tax=Physella acuta TaxID=109671 RepID=UPI0027DBDD62|nr:cadherin-4-like [Physella acuta]
MMDFRFVVLLLSLCFHWSNQSTNVAPPPDIMLSTIDVEVNEKEDRQIDLHGGALVTCADDDPSRAYIATVTPSSPCGKKCFQLQPCGGAGNASEFCLYFLPSEGSLNYVSAPAYTLSIGCTDDVEPTSFKTMTVTVVPNTPPVFVPATPLTASVTVDGSATKAGTVLYDVNANDIDGDPIYYTATYSPLTSYISTGLTNGEIRATNDLKYVCQSSITATIKATDNYNPPITKTVEITLNPHNTPPTITNLDTTIPVEENSGALKTVLTLGMVDDGIGTVSCKMSSVSDAGLEMYKLVMPGYQLQTKIDPNYERSDTRSVKLYFDCTDGYCSSPTYSLTLNVQNINEQCSLTPSVRSEIKVYEGDIVADTGVTLYDQDIGDTHVYTKTSGPNEFNVDPGSGSIVSTSTIDIDKNTQVKYYTVGYKATDKGGLSCTATVTLAVYDANDNPPYFTNSPYTMAATECTELGSVIGRVSGDDDDSPYQSNDKFTFGGGGDKMAVMSNGNVVLTQPCIDGEYSSGTATIVDQGEYPGPLSGIPATITMTCGPCPPTTPAPTPAPVVTTKAPTTAAPITTTKKATSTSSSSDRIADLMAWVIPAAIGGLIWLALTAYFIYRYCFPCRNPCAGRCARKPKVPKLKPKPEPKPPKPQKPKQVAPPPPPPPPKVVTPPPPPPPPEPKPDPYLFGFWKEQYTDQDHQTQQPVRASKPQPIENMPPAEVVPRGNAVPPEYLKLGNPGPGQMNPPAAPAKPPVVAQAAPKNKTCIIL